MLDSMASAPPFATYLRPQQHSVVADQRFEDHELSAALAASLTDYQHQQRHHQHQRAATATSSHPSARIDIDAVNAVAQVCVLIESLETQVFACDIVSSFRAGAVGHGEGGGGGGRGQ